MQASMDLESRLPNTLNQSGQVKKEKLHRQKSESNRASAKRKPEQADLGSELMVSGSAAQQIGSMPNMLHVEILPVSQWTFCVALVSH